MPGSENQSDPLEASRAGARAVAGSPAADRARAALAGARQIAILTKFRFMGDTVVATPFLGQLRRHYPNAAITLVAAPSVQTALANCPHLDRIVPLDVRGRSRWQHGRELYSVLRSGRFDVAFLLNRSLHCAATTALAAVPARIGYVNEFRRTLLTVPIPYYFDRNEVDCHLDMLRALGMPATDALPDLWISEEEQARAREILRERGWSGGPLIGVQPGANDPGIREWGAERYARVADVLAQETGAQIVLMGGEGEGATAARMADALHAHPINLVAELKLRDALAVIGQCGLWLGNDTGLLHCAVAQRVASVGLFGPNKVVRWGYNAPRHRSLVVFPDEPARDDSAVRRCLDAIAEEDVLAAARTVLRETEGASAGAWQEARSLAPAKPPYFAATLTSSLLAPARRR